jgi:SAM-dependent methyltransferase
MRFGPTGKAATSNSKMAARAINSCAICGAEGEFEPQVRLRHGIVHTCSACGSGLLLPRPNQKQLAALHSEDEYFDHPYFVARRSLTPALKVTYDTRLALLTSALGSLVGRRILDVGCDVGLFVRHAQETVGAICTGIDISVRAVAVGKASGLDMRATDLENAGLSDESFDAICAFDLIEHLDNPKCLFGRVRQVLRPGGVLLLETPNYDGIVYRLSRYVGRLPLRRLQERLWPPFHVQYFTSRSLENLLREMGLVTVRISGREPSTSEVNLAGALRMALAISSTAAKALNRATLLMAIARKEASCCLLGLRQQRLYLRPPG